MEKRENIIYYGEESTLKNVPIFSINLEGVLPGELSCYLSRNKIITRSGLHCAPYVHKTLGTAPCGTIRISLNHLNTKREINQLFQCLDAWSEWHRRS